MMSLITQSVGAVESDTMWVWVHYDKRACVYPYSTYVTEDKWEQNPDVWPK